MSAPGESLPPVPVELPGPAYLVDHTVEGRPVLPAVEALQLLADAARQRVPDLDVLRSGDAAFLRFLGSVPAPGAVPPELWAELRPLGDGRVQASLLGRVRAGRAGLPRRLEHVRVCFGAAQPAPACGGGEAPWPPATTVEARAGGAPGPDATPGTPQLSFDAGRLYGELVPFGPAYHNARGEVLLGPDGASAQVVAPAEAGCAADAGRGHSRSLGSPFPLDAAFHLACAWGQAASGRVLFPTGYGARTVHQPILPGAHCRCQVRVRARGEGWASFDLWLFAADGRLVEEARAVRMQDLFRGQRTPPAWIARVLEPALPPAGQAVR